MKLPGWAMTTALLCDILDAKTFVNGIVGLMATGGSTNLVLHLPAMARAAGILLELQDFDDLSQATPLMAKVYPNGLADVNHFHASGGLGYLIGDLLNEGLLHPDTKTVVGTGLADYTQEPVLNDGCVTYRPGAAMSGNDKILRSVKSAFQPTGGLRQLAGNLGQAMMKISAVAPERHVIEARARVFHTQDAVKVAFKAGEFTQDTIIVVRFQGPMSNGMPELHALTPCSRGVARPRIKSGFGHRRSHVGSVWQSPFGDPPQSRGRSGWSAGAGL